MSLLTITSVPAETVKPEELQIVARWKNTDARPIATANRVRAVILPKTIWETDTNVTPVQFQPLRLFVLDGLEQLATDYLRSVVEDSNWQRTQVPADAFTLSSLLTWQADQAAISGRLNGDTIKAWLTSSVTIASVTQVHGAKVGEALGAQLVKLASPNHGLTPEKADKLLSNLWKSEDADSTTGLRVMLRLQAIRDKAQDSANVLDSIL